MSDTAALPALSPVHGFRDHAADSQQVFRLVLDAMSRPGTHFAVPDYCVAPAPLLGATAALALTLFDQRVSVWLDDSLAGDGIRQFLRFNTGVTFTDDPDTAQFGLIGTATTMPALHRFCQGTELEPERSTTLIVQVTSLTAGVAVELRGPGIETSRTLSVSGLPNGFASAWAENTGRAPCGVDLILTDGVAIVGLPRTTRWS